MEKKNIICDKLDYLKFEIIKKAETSGFYIIHNSTCGVLLKNEKGNEIEIISKRHPNTGFIIIEDYIKLTIDGNPTIIGVDSSIKNLKF